MLSRNVSFLLLTLCDCARLHRTTNLRSFVWCARLFGVLTRRRGGESKELRIQICAAAIVALSCCFAFVLLAVCCVGLAVAENAEVQAQVRVPLSTK